jgi:hypothetical protein
LTEHLPEPDPARVAAAAVTADDTVVLPAGSRLVRVHCLAGAHPVAWDGFRSYGPTTSRFDHHVPPPAVQDRAIAYVTYGEGAFVAGLGEFFQHGERAGPIDRSRCRAAVTAFDTTRDLVLLDLHGGWVTRAGGNQAITSGPREPTRRWARAVYDAHAGVDGVAWRSSVWGPGRCAALWERAADALPAAPAATRTLDDPLLAAAVADAAARLGVHTV